MEQLTYRFSLDTHKNGVQRTLQGFETGDGISRRLVINLTEEDRPYMLPLDNVVAAMYVKRPSQTSPSINTCSIEGDRIVYELTDSDLEEAGIVTCQLKLIFGTIEHPLNVIVSPRFDIEVWESMASDSVAEDTQEYTALEAALAKAQMCYEGRIISFSIDDSTGVLTVVYGYDEETQTHVTYTSDYFKDNLTPSIEVGTVTEGDTMSVTNSGTALHAIFDFILKKGEKGDDGFSAVANVVKSGDTATITITDKTGTTTAEISDGADGQDGQDGQDGYSPSASVTKSGDTATISITDKNGTTTAQISDGADGQDGQDGQDGADGYSPTATVTKSGSIATITITDKNGTTTAQISDGTGTTTTWNQIQQSGDKIGEITINGTKTDVYSPSKALGDLTDVSTTGASVGQVLTKKTTGYEFANAPSGGLYPHIIVISDEDSTVRAVKDGTTINFTETSAGHYEGDVTSYGVWTIHSVLEGDDATTSLNVDDCKIYTIDDRHFHASITVNYPDGGSCSCAMTGETTLYANTCPYTFVVHKEGTWTISTTEYGDTFTETVTITTDGQTETITLPDGETVTPTDDVPTWLCCGGIGDSEDATLADVLADSATLNKLIASANAVKYLVRSTTFASTIAGNSGAMTAIGLDNNCANTLIADSTWRTALFGSTYFESVFNLRVPVMTSNTTPSGTVSSSGSTTGYDPWKAFRNGTAEAGYSWIGDVNSTSATNKWLAYTFASAVKCYGFWVKFSPFSSNVNYKLQGNKGSYVDLTDNYTISTTTSDSPQNKALFTKNLDTYNTYRLYINSVSNNEAVGLPRVATLQFYGREDV